MASDVQSDSKAGAVLSNGLNQNSEEKDLEGVALLRHIFPDESIEDLRKLHDERIHHSASKRRDAKYSSFSEHSISPTHEKTLINRHGNRVNLPGDFLRLPLNKAVRRYNNKLHKWEYQLVEHLHKRAFSQHRRNTRCTVSEENFYTRVLERHAETGLGITLTESMGFVRVFGQSSNCHETETKINPGDIVVGINGCTLLEIILNKQSMLRETVRLLKSSPSPVCVHLQKVSTGVDMKKILPAPSTISLLDTTFDESFQSEQSFELSKAYLEPSVHPLTLALISRGLVKNSGYQVTRTLQQFAKRVRQWNFSHSFHIDEKHNLLSPLSGPGDQQSAFTTPSRRNQPATYLTPGSATDELSIGGSSYFSGTTPRRLHELPSIFIPLCGVRKALSVRILHSFLDSSGYDTRAIYTIWVYDVESGHEWYAPSRYFSDFKDLRANLMNLRSDIAGIDFPAQAWFSFGSSEASESATARETKCKQLEHFLRTLCAMIYTYPLHPAVAEVAIHIQSFLGCDHVSPSELAQQTPSPVKSTYEAPKHTYEQIHKRALLKRELQLYAYRIFLLDPVAKVVSQFVDAARANGPSLNDIEKMQAKSRNGLKKRANSELEKIQAVVDQLQDLILEGCMHDLQVIAESETFDSLRDLISGEAYWDRLSREAIRTQVEIEVYVPLRGTVSRLLVNAWRHEDMAVSFKILVSTVL